jgi:hypothetical protein
MAITRPLSESLPPGGTWQRRADWTIASVHDAITVRNAACEIVGPDDAAAAAAALSELTSLSGRVQAAMGELVANGLHHGGPPVLATLSRGTTGWLLVVSDAAVESPPIVATEPVGTAKGGLGLRLVVSMATAAGWYTDDTRKHVWALIGDQPPSHLLAALHRHS